MSPLSVGDFLALLRQSNVLSAEQWAELRHARLAPPISAKIAPQTASDDPKSAEIRSTTEIVDWLIDRGWLTRWQADMLLSGRTTLFLGKYRLLECIGTGGMGAVFKARHGQMERTVALKVMASSVIRKRKGVARFHKEIQAAAALDHPNIVAAFDADCVGNVHFLVMEYVEGHDLGWYVAQKGALPIGWVCECIRQSALGLQHAHEQGMVHRDIKPTNLLVTRDPETGRPLAKLLDLGLARFSTETDLESDEGSSQYSTVSELTQAGQVLGTPDYMAPEQATNTRAADARCDIFSLGCTLFRLITGEFPFPGETAAEKIKARQKGIARRIGDYRRDVPPQLEALVVRMMAVDPNQRIQTAREVATALTPFCLPDDTGIARLVTPKVIESSSSHGIQPGDDPRLRQFFTHLANQAADETSTRSDPKLRIPHLSRKAIFSILIGAGSMMLLVAGWYWGGQTTLEVDWSPSQRRQGTLTINDREIVMPADRELQVTGRSGRWEVRMTRPGYETISKTLEFKFGERQLLVPEWRPLLQTVRKEELVTLKRRVSELASTDPLAPPAIELRSDFIRFRSKYASSAEADAATALLEKLPSPLDRLSRESIPESALLQAGQGDLKQASPAILAILGEGRCTFWNRVISLSVSRDARWIAAASIDGTVRIFDQQTATERHVLRLSAEPREIAFSPAEDTLAVAGSRREVTLWNAVDGTLRKSFRDAGEPLAFSPDGSLLAAGGRRTEILIFDTGTFKIRRTLNGPIGSAARALVFSPDGRRLASQGADAAVALWEVTSDGEPRRFQKSFRPRFNPDGSLLATGSGDGDIRVWKAEDGSLQQTLRRGGDPLGFIPDGRSFISYRSGRAMIWDPATGDERRLITGVPALALLSPDGTTLAAANQNTPDFRFWNLQTGASVSVSSPQGPIAALAFTPDSSRVISAGIDHVIRQWSPLTGREEGAVGPSWGPVTCDPDGRMVAIARSGKVELWDVMSPGKPLRTLEGDAPDLAQLLWSPSGRLIAGCGGARFLKSSLRLWEADNGRESEVDNDQTGAMRAMAFGASGQRLATVGDGRKVVLWDTTKRAILQTFEGAPERPLAMAFDRERRTLAAAGTADTVALWDLQTRVARSLTFDAKPGFRHLTFGPDGRSLVAAAAGGVLIRDIATGKLLRTLSCKPGTPTWVSLSPTGDRLAAVGNTGTVYIWNWQSKTLPSEEADLKLSIGPSGGLIRQVAWSLDGRHLLTINGNSTLYVVRLPQESTAD